MEIQQEKVQGCLPIGLNGICLKPLTAYLKLISSKWMIFIIMVFPSKSSPLRYSEIKGRVENITSEKISDTTLSSRLNELLSNEILVRTQFIEIPPRVEYHLTKKGIELQETLQPLIEWAIRECHETKR